MKSWLLDTGPVVAYLDASDQAHQSVAICLDSFTGRLMTTGAVVVEAMHLLGTVRSGPAMLVEFLVASRTEIHNFTATGELIAAVELMATYADTPMDFADASLVLLGQRKKVDSICTLDRRGFRTYRLGRKAFKLVLDD